MLSLEDFCRRFENREAIYVEKGALRVRVHNLQSLSEARAVMADVDEIPTPGLGVGVYRTYDFSVPHAPVLSWDIGAGCMTSFSENTWAMGYGGWYLFFSHSVVEGIVKLASEWPCEASSSAPKRNFPGYIHVLNWLDENGAYEQQEKLFADE